MDYTNPQYWPQLKQLAVQIDGMDYYQILNLPQTAKRGDVKQVYYAMYRALHPDKFYHLPDEQLKTAVTKIYKRITESYTILKDDKKRERYLEGINGPHRADRLRYNEQVEGEAKREERAAKEVAKTPQGKKMYNAAVAAIKSENWDEAYRQLQSAMMFEMGNEAIKKLKDEVDMRRKG
jgi:curved DNA-binding protein CbpA